MINVSIMSVVDERRSVGDSYHPIIYSVIADRKGKLVGRCDSILAAVEHSDKNAFNGTFLINSDNHLRYPLRKFLPPDIPRILRGSLAIDPSQGILNDFPIFFSGKPRHIFGMSLSRQTWLTKPVLRRRIIVYSDKHKRDYPINTTSRCCNLLGKEPAE
jgi:hypothetical protein